MAFRALETVLFGLEGGFTGPAHLVPKPLPFRLTMSQVLISCAGVKLIAGASGESRVVNSPSPVYPHVWSKQAGQCLPGCALEQIQATMQKQAGQNFSNLPR